MNDVCIEKLTNFMIYFTDWQSKKCNCKTANSESHLWRKFEKFHNFSGLTEASFLARILTLAPHENGNEITEKTSEEIFSSSKGGSNNKHGIRAATMDIK